MTNEDILIEARKRFQRAESWESYARINFLADKKFYAGDSFNCFQWDQGVSDARMRLDKPVLTINRTKVLCDSIINDGRESQPSIKIRAVGNSASYKSSEIYEGVIRHIEYISSAQECYDTAMFNQIVSGWGYWRIITDYADEDSFDQEIFIKRIADPLSVYMDPDITTQSGEDQKWCFLFKDMLREDFRKEYGAKYDDVPSVTLEDDHFEWMSDDHIRVAEYYRIETTKDTLYSMSDGSIIKGSDFPDPEITRKLKTEAVKSRDVDVPVVKWHLLGGDKIIDEKIFPGTYIPVVRLIGTETVIQGRLDRAGHVRNLRSPQQIYNAMNSAGVEAVGLQSKIPWIISNEAIGAYSDMWDQANTTNFAYLLYNGYDVDGQRVIPPPTKAEPPVYPNAYAQSMQIAMQDMVEATGQEPASLGAPGNERSAKAIQERIKGGDRATFHFSYRLAEAIRLTGRIIVGLIPIVYDTERVISILAFDSSYVNVKIDPNQQSAHQPVPEEEIYSPEDVQMIWNPKVGKYDITADSGPNYASKRAEAFNAMTQLMSQNHEISPIMLDQYFLTMDIPGADILAQRFRNMLPTQATGEGPSKEEQQLQAQLAQQHELIGKTMMENQDLKTKILLDQQQKDIDMYAAETNRLKVIAENDQEGTLPLMREMISQLLGERINPLIEAHAIENTLLQRYLGQINPEGDQSPQGGSPPILPENQPENQPGPAQ